MRTARVVILLLGIGLLGFGAWGLTEGALPTAHIAGFGTVLVVGALLVVLAMLMPWLSDGPLRLGPLSLTLRIRARPKWPRRRRRK